MTLPITTVDTTPPAGLGYNVVPSTSLLVGRVANFTAGAHDVAGVTFRWDFGDGETALGANVSHAYAAAGRYTVSLNVSDPSGNRANATISMLVALTRGPAPAAVIRRALRGIDAVQVPENHGRIRVLTPRLVDAVHGTDTEVHVWTVNDPADMRRLMDLGVDGIVTDRADVALDVRGG